VVALGAVAAGAGGELLPHAAPCVSLLSALMGHGSARTRAAATEAMGHVLLALGAEAVPAVVWQRR
jgi:hypothetical protein